MRSGGGAFTGGPAAEGRLLEGRGQVGHVEGTDIGTGRDDLVDPVEDLVGDARDQGVAYSQRMVALLIDGLRYGAGTTQSRS